MRQGGDKADCKVREDTGLSLMSLQMSHLSTFKTNLTAAYEPYQFKKNTLKIFLKHLKCSGKFRRQLFCLSFVDCYLAGNWMEEVFTFQLYH